MPATRGDRPAVRMTWAEFDKLVDVLVKALKKDIAPGNIGAIAGIYRGGAVLARCLAARLNDVPMMVVDCMDGGETGRFSCYPRRVAEAISRDEPVLLVDDISDSGETFGKCLEAMKQAGFSRVITMALVCKKGTCHVPDYSASSDEGNEWVIFPWEVP